VKAVPMDAWQGENLPGTQETGKQKTQKNEQLTLLD